MPTPSSQQHSPAPGAIGSPPAMRTGEIHMSVDPAWGSDASICIRKDDPLPLTLLSTTLEVALGG